MVPNTIKYPSPKWLLIKTSAIVFLTELTVMYFQDVSLTNIHISAFLDAALTMALTSILMYRFSFIPINQQIKERIKESDTYRIQKAYLDQLIENAPEAIVILDNTDKVLRINSEFTRLFGYEAQEAIGRDLNSLIVPEELIGLASSISHNVADGQKASFESVRQRKDGSKVDVSVLGTPVRLEGDQIGIYAIYRDITEQKKMEEKLEKSEKYYRTLIENSLDFVAVLDLHGVITYYTPSLERALSLNSQELLNQSVFSLVHPEDLDKVRSSFSATVANPGTTYVVESRVRRQDGSWLTWQIKGICISGDNPYIVTNATDITARKSAEDKIRQLSVAIEQSPVSVVITDTNGRIEYVNPWFSEITGYSALEAIGQKPSILKSGYTPDSEYKKLWETITAGGRWRGEFQNRKKNGEMYWEFATIAGIKGADGRIRNFIAVKDDITAQKLAEKSLIEATERAQSAMRAKSDFLATMSHEIRTPMNGVIGMTELLLDTDLTAEQRDFVETIQVSGDTLLTILNDILDYSKIESGKMEFEKREFDLTHCLETTLDVFSSKAAEKNIELIYSIDPSVPTGLIGDETRIKQILMNLTNNALKFTDTGEVYISVQNTDARNNGHVSDEVELLFKVKDTGIGIPQDKMDRLFKSFSQVDSSTTRKYGGTGLGLAISDKLVAMMGGRIWVDSTDGWGSTFSFTVKLGVNPEAPLQKNSVPAVIKDKRVLIVDDNDTNRQILSIQCARMGMTAKATESPLEALTWIGHGQLFDLGIIDMHMPEMDGLHLGLAIREMRSKEFLPLLMLSSLGNKVKPEQYPDDVFSAFVSKPVKQAQLQEMIMSFFAGRKKEKPVFQSAIDSQLAKRLPLNILLAEDNVINQKLAVLTFQKMGYDVDVAHNGLTVLNMLQDKPYDIIFMDVQMPEMDGLEATRRIRDLKSPDRTPRIIAMTANAMKEDRDQCLEAGMDDFITKPINIKQIQSKLLEWGGSMSLNNPVDIADKRIVDTEQLKDIGVTAEFFKELTDMYIDQSKTLIDEIKDYAHLGDLVGFRKLAHNLKGISANIGAVAMVEVCHELEKIQPHHRPKEINVLIHKLGITYEETRFHLEKIMMNEELLNSVEAA